ncbi:hypothetical protein BSLG_009566 [Batrachochytrium salamandrivorans]|nr:hypothetical protein BSLG_009566 [Batrachochytrium salamandrivorans]
MVPSLITVNAAIVNTNHLEARAATAASAWPSRVLPYCDVLLWPTFDIATAAATIKNKHFTLAFITADGSGKGSMGPELALVPNNNLVAEYKSVIDMYSLTYIDFDIEGAATMDVAANTRRAKALATHQKNLTLWRWTMDLALHNGATGMGGYAIAAAQATRAQLKPIFPSATIGIPHRKLAKTIYTCRSPIYSTHSTHSIIPVVVPSTIPTPPLHPTPPAPKIPMPNIPGVYNWPALDIWLLMQLTVQAGVDCTLYPDSWYLSQIQQIRNFGGDVMISLVDPKVHRSLTAHPSMCAVPLSVVSRLSFQISVLHTLPATPTGLSSDAMYVLTSAYNAGVRVDVVNVLTLPANTGVTLRPLP